MALSRQNKEKQVQELAEKMKNASSVIFANYQGLSVAAITKFRQELKKEDALMQVAKKTLIKISAKEAGAPDIDLESLSGDIACIFSTGEPTAGAAVAHKFSKDNPAVKLVGGIFSAKILSANEAKALATIPSKQVLLATFMGMVRSPLVSFASALSSPLTGFARAMAELAKKKESSPTPVVGSAEVPVEAPVSA